MMALIFKDNQAKHILITGGRAPAALDIARKLHRKGHSVYVLDSIKNHLCRFSRAVKKSFFVPEPHNNEEAFIKKIREIIKDNSISLVIPTCEEVFYLANNKEQIENENAILLTTGIETLELLHNKKTFNDMLHSFTSIKSCKTCVIHNQQEFEQKKAAFQGQSLIIKPVYSRFGSNVSFLSVTDSLPDGISISPEHPWMVQEYLSGKTISTYAICDSGRVLVNVCYFSNYTTGTFGAGIYFSAVDKAKIDCWVKEIVKKLDYTGQIAFDLIETEDGSIWPIECNPRATSGVHLLVDNDLEKAMIKKVEIKKNRVVLPKKQLTIPMLMYGVVNIIKTKSPLHWIKRFFSTSDILFSIKDPLPFLMQITMLIELLKRMLKQKISLLEATTHDIEWNGK